MCSNSSKQVHLKFTHNNVHSQGNHYDPIVCDDSTKTNLDILASVAEYATKMPTNDVVCIDSDDKDMICEMTTSNEPVCIDVETPQKKSSKVKYDTDEIPEIKRGKYFPIHLFDNMEPETVEYIPGNIDGLKL